MSEKDNNKTPQNSTKTHSDKKEFNYIVSEGSVVHIDVRDFLNSKDISNYRSYSYSLNPTKDTPVFANFYKDNLIFSFKAPFIREDKKIKTQLNFELTIKDNKNSLILSHSVNVIVKRVQRAIIFQGGVSLGAYEVGVFNALVEKLEEHDSKNNLRNQRPLFDIVAGTSIGAMNAAIVVSDIKNHKSWKESANDLVKFWEEQKSQWPTVADNLNKYPIYRGWWDVMHNTGKASKESVSTLTELYSEMNPYFKEWTNNFIDWFIDGWYIPATSEAARRYYSAKQFLTVGAPNVATGIPPWSIFGKFFDLTDQANLLPRPDNKHFVSYSLKKTLEQFVNRPIKTTMENNEPRFLLVTVDVQTGDAVTFDSYEKKKDAKDTEENILKDKEGNNLTKYYSEYGNAQNKHLIFYNKGIEIDHILASGTFPSFFDYPRFEVENISPGKSIVEHHIFWDGGFRSNTPLREVIQAHRDYYFDKKDKLDMKDKRHLKEKYIKDEESVPDLEIYIADLWPSELKEEPISFDLDFVENRNLGIIFGDKTDYDEQVASVVTDYIDLARELRNLARRKGISEDEIKFILDKKGSSKNREGYKRTYNELLEGRFRITKVVRIDHKDDGHEVSNKIFDYSRITIEKLMKDGYYDALVQLGIESIKDEFSDLDDKFRRLNNEKGIDMDYIPLFENLQKCIQQIQNTMKIEDGHDEMAIMNQVDNFIREVSSISDLVDHGTLKEEKALLIDAAKQFQQTIKMIKGNNIQPKIPSP